MRLLEFEAKRLLKGYGIPIPSGKLVYSVEEVQIEGPSVLKAQIPAGGRKKAGGVVFVSDEKEARKEASRIFGAPLRGYPVEGLLIEDQIPIEREIFLAVTYDTTAKSAIAILSTEGGVDIEGLAKPKFLLYQESNLLIPKLFLRKRTFIYMTTAQEAQKPAPGAETSPLIDET